MKDCIFVRGIELFARHGVFAEEAALGQRFEIDIECELDATPYSRTDDEDAAVRYDHIYETVRSTVVDGERVKLIETLAERLAGAVLEGYPAVERVTVEVRKPSAPVPGPFGSIGVRIARERTA